MIAEGGELNPNRTLTVNDDTASGDVPEIDAQWFDCLPLGVLLLDADNNLRAINERGREILEIDQGAFARDALDSEDISFIDSLADSQRPAWRKVIAQARATETETFVPRFFHYTGSLEKVLQVRFSHVLGGHRTAQMMLVLDDITDQVISEKYLLVSERLAAQGEMASAVTHRLNNHLTVIGNHAALLQRHLGSGDYVRASSNADKIAAQVMKIKIFTEQLVGLSRPEAEFMPFDLSHLVRDVMWTVGADASLRHVSVVVDCDQNLPPIDIDVAMMQSALIELIRNAVEATVMSSDHENEPIPQVSITCRPLTDSDMVVIEVSDQGCGIAPEDIGRVFQPHFTTRNGAHGLGLTNVHRVVRIHRGRISIDSTPGLGTKICIQLPTKQPSKDDRDSLR
ncbi:MAG: ATP-binding protein [bacterium]